MIPQRQFPPLPALIVGVVLIAIFGYAIVTTLPFLLGPEIRAEIKETGGVITVQGEVARIAKLFINDMPTPLTESGSFLVERVYPSGYTVVVVRAEDRFGRTIEKTLTTISTLTIPYGTKENNEHKSEEGNDS